MPVRYFRLSRLAFTRKPATVLVAPIRSTMVSNVRRGFATLAHRLKAVPEFVEEASHRRGAHAPSVVRQRRRELRSTLAGPSQRRHGVATGERIDQLLERLFHSRVRLLDARSSRTDSAHPCCDLDSAFHLAAALADRYPRNPRRRRNNGVTSVADGSRLRRRPQT